jgi:hypothetical protein
MFNFKMDRYPCRWRQVYRRNRGYDVALMFRSILFPELSAAIESQELPLVSK